MRRVTGMMWSEPAYDSKVVLEKPACWVNAPTRQLSPGRSCTAVLATSLWNKAGIQVHTPERDPVARSDLPDRFGPMTELALASDTGSRDTEITCIQASRARSGRRAVNTEVCGLEFFCSSKSCCFS